MKIAFCFLFGFSCALIGAELPDKFVRAIHHVETGGKLGNIKGDSGAALGPLQIHRVCFKDAQEYDKSLSKYKYEDVAQLPVAKKVMTAYLNRYVKTAVELNNFEEMARIWNGGPKGHKNPKTINYWLKVKKNLEKL